MYTHLQGQKESQVHNDILVPSTSRGKIMVDNISCDTYNQRKIVEDIISSRLDEIFMWDRQKLFNQSK